MNLKAINAQDQPSYNRLNIIPFQSNLEDHTSLVVAQSAIKLQTNLLKSSISYIQSVSGRLILKTTLKNILETLAQYSEAGEGSIFLVDEEGMIVESILARGPVTRDLKDTLISKVLDGGLAGWSLRHRQIGIIYDAVIDDRWVQLPDQPYTSRSALALPLIYGVEAIGVITLTHSDPDYFGDEIATFMQYLMEGITAIIINAQLHAKYKPLGL